MEGQRTKDVSLKQLPKLGSSQSAPGNDFGFKEHLSETRSIRKGQDATTPVIVIDSAVIVGFDSDALSDRGCRIQIRHNEGYGGSSSVCEEDRSSLSAGGRGGG